MRGTRNHLESEAYQRGLQAGDLGSFLPPPSPSPLPPRKARSLWVGLPPPLPHSRMEVGVPGEGAGGPGRSPAAQASLPREPEAQPRPADLLLEVRGQGRPSRPHFLQPRPTPCGPRVYGNSGLDGFSEIIRSRCPHLTPPARRGTEAGWGVCGGVRSERSGEGRDPFPGGPGPALPQHFFFLGGGAFKDQGPGSAFLLHNLLLGGGLYFPKENTEAQKGHVTMP